MTSQQGDSTGSGSRIGGGREARPHAPPAWWPTDEPWPPRSRWGPPRHRVARRVGCLAGLVMVVAAAGTASVVWHLATAASGPRGGPGGFMGLLLVGVVALAVVGVAVGRGVRGLAVPLDDLIEGARRIEGGEYRARVPERPWGPPELRGLARAFNAMAARLETDERQRRSLLADVSHELRTPLSVLQGELEAMVDGVHPADGAHLAATLDETRVLSRLVEDLRTLALAEARTLTLHREPTDLGVLAAEVAEGARVGRDPEREAVSVAVADDVPLLDVDPVRIREVLSNLVANALRYTPPDAVARIAVTRSSTPARRPEVVVAVADDGPGISPELLPHVFDRFAKSAESRGSGLGLAIARQLVEAHGGWMAAESPSGGGTTVRFGLPIEPSGA